MIDPAEQTVDEVVAYAEEHPDEIDQLLEDEEEGKNRVTLVNKLKALRDDSTTEDDDDEEDDDEDDTEEAPADEALRYIDPNVYPDPENIPHTP